MSKGLVQELRFAARAIELGHSVYVPYASLPTDLIVSGKKVQLKTMTVRSSGRSYLDCRRCRKTDRHTAQRYRAADVDVFACWGGYVLQWALIPFAEVAGRQTIELPSSSLYWENWSVFDDPTGP